ncbi:hypothetical protein HMPREF9946_03978 [Acetobacteraceae bacterium AT-5844]|nr:hypothetical protein HMPREF9946_03978 [Acetobacteraceae bacterium AT-5844]
MPNLPAAAGATLRTRLRPGAEARRRAGILFRVVAAIGGGYAVAALFTSLLSLSLPMPRAEAVMTATMASFAIYAGVIVWVFAASSALRAWAGMAVTALLLAGALFLLQGLPA